MVHSPDIIAKIFYQSVFCQETGYFLWLLFGSSFCLCLSVCLSVCLSPSLSLCLSVYLSVCLFLSLSVKRGWEWRGKSIVHHSFRIPQFNYVDRIIKLRFRRLYRVKIEELANNMSRGRHSGFMSIRLHKKHGPVFSGQITRVFMSSSRIY